MADIAPRHLASEEINDYFHSTVNQITSPHDEVDLVSVQHPLFEAMKATDTYETREPGQGLVEDLLVKAVHHKTLLSMTQEPDRSFVAENSTTQAKFEWVQMESHIFIPKMEYDNWTSLAQFGSAIQRKKKPADIGRVNDLVDYFWNGLTVGTNNVFGVRDFVRGIKDVGGTPTIDTIGSDWTVKTNPARGNIGNIDAANTVGIPWYNYAHDYDTAYLTVTSGEPAYMTDGASSFLTLWLKLTSNGKGLDPAGRPNMIACNETGFAQFAHLVDRKFVFMDKTSNFDLLPSDKKPKFGDGYFYKGAYVFYDPSVPESPTSGEGTFYFLNTNSFSFVLAKGLSEDWGDMKTDLIKPGYFWTRTTQFSMTCRDRRMNGVFFGTKAAAIS